MAPGNWQLVVCGTDHKLSTLEQREALQIGHEEIAAAHSMFGDLPGVYESAVISTCNRIEYYFVTPGEREPFESVKSFYLKFRNLDISELGDRFFSRKNKHAADHLLRVCAGLESMVIGENQILGQVKESYSSACAVKTAGKVIHRLFHQAFRVGKQVRTDTEMGKGACSISSAAIEMLQARVNNIDKPRVLFIGVNQMIFLAASGVVELEHGDLFFANRTVEKARSLAAKFGATGYSLDQLPSLMAKVDIVISCTGSQESIINGAMIEKAAASKRPDRVLIIDLAIPRDVEIGNTTPANVEIYDLESVKRHVTEHQQKRELAIPLVEKIIERRLDEFLYWFDHVRHEPIYNGLADSFERVRTEEIEPLLEKLPDDLKGEVEKTSKALIKKLLQLKVQESGTK
jgi:glutamyl-tRNA reductase